jgi:glycosyltransferase involved in cell wall biosynthesis
MTLELIRHLLRAAPDIHFVLLTCARNHDELSQLDAPNAIRFRTDVPWPDAPVWRNLLLRIRRAMPGPALERISLFYQRLSKRSLLEKGLLRSLGADLLFCPLTALNFYDASMPAVSVIHDLQHRYYPEFFDPADLQERNRTFEDACRKARFLVCASHHVRNTILEQSTVAPEQVEVIPILLPRRLERPSCERIEQTLRPLGLAADAFLLYPANFWPHKNHVRLLEAFRIYTNAHLQSDLKLVLTGVPGPRRDAVRELCRRDPVLSHRVVFAGYLSDADFSAVFHACRAIVFPSLFEGFGMPLLEGMAAGKPLLVSNAASLPEIAGDAALYFDPMRTDSIAGAVDCFQRDAVLRQELGEKASDRLRAFGGPAEMAVRYLDLFHRAVKPDTKVSP